MSLSLLDLLNELEKLQNTRAGAGCKEDAWKALDAINGLLSNIFHEYNLLVKGLLDGIPIDSNCPICCEELVSHEETCAVHRAELLLKR